MVDNTNRQQGLLTISDTARRLGVCRLTVRRLIAAGKLEAVDISEKQRRVLVVSVDRLLQGKALPDSNSEQEVA